jgi:hypothetical protein
MIKQLWNESSKSLKIALLLLFLFSYSYWLLDITEALFIGGVINLYYVLRYAMQVMGAICFFIYFKEKVT